MRSESFFGKKKKVRGRKLRKSILDELGFLYKIGGKCIVRVHRLMFNTGFKGIMKFWDTYSGNEKEY